MQIRLVAAALVVLAVPALSHAGLYRSNNNGDFGIVNPDTGNFSVLGNPGNGSPLSGICLDNLGDLYGSVRQGQATDLIEISPSTGDRIRTVGTITNGMSDLKITDLACQPGTGIIFGLDGSSPAKLFTIDKTTAAATLVGTTPVERGGLGFSPGGSLYAASVTKQVAQLNPADGSAIGLIIVDTVEGACLDGLALRPSDGKAFATGCDSDNLYKLNLSFGAVDFVGDMGDAGADLVFIDRENPAPAVSQVGLLMLGLCLGVAAFVRIRRKRESIA